MLLQQHKTRPRRRQLLQHFVSLRTDRLRQLRHRTPGVTPPVDVGELAQRQERSRASEARLATCREGDVEREAQVLFEGRLDQLAGIVWDVDGDLWVP